MQLQHKPTLKSKGQLTDDKGDALPQSGQLALQIGYSLADGDSGNHRRGNVVGMFVGLHLVGGDIHEIITKCKNPVFVKLIARGKEAHGSTPWAGIDANEILLQTWQNIRQIYPYYSLEHNEPQNQWVDTVHMAKIEGGQVSNVISNYAEALLDFRLTENSTVENLEKNLQKCLLNGVTYKIVSASTPVVMDENNPLIQSYKQLAEKTINQPLRFVQ